MTNDYSTQLSSPTTAYYSRKISGWKIPKKPSMTRLKVFGILQKHVIPAPYYPPFDGQLEFLQIREHSLHFSAFAHDSEGLVEVVEHESEDSVVDQWLHLLVVQHSLHESLGVCVELCSGALYVVRFHIILGPRLKHHLHMLTKFTIIQDNEPGRAQVGAISKAQK